MRTIGYHYFFAWGLASTKNIYSHNIPCIAGLQPYKLNWLTNLKNQN